MDTTTTHAADAVWSEVIIHAPRADELVQLARSGQVRGAERAEVQKDRGSAR
jgi:hypothetical protein